MDVRYNVVHHRFPKVANKLLVHRHMEILLRNSHIFRFNPQFLSKQTTGRTKQNKMKVSVVILVKNEPYAQIVVEKIHCDLSDIPHEILLQTEEGMANAVWHGIQRAKGEYVAVMDADGSHRPSDLLAMVKRLESSNVDLVLGSRRWLYQPLHRKIISLACAWFTRHFLGLNLRDPLTTFVAGKREVMQFQNFKGSKFTLEILMSVPLNRVAEHYVINEPRKEGKSKIKLVEGVYLLKQLLRARGCT